MENKQLDDSQLPWVHQVILLVVSFLLVSFGQPAWCWWCGLLAAACGYGLFWRVLICYATRWQRFWLAAAWFTAVQLVQLSWFLSHPYYYIYPIYFLFALGEGVQFGIVSLLLDIRYLDRFKRIFLIAALWTVFEWSRLFILAGLSWNPVGIALTGSLYPMQAASLFGVYGLSFWVIFVNLLWLRSWKKHWAPLAMTLWLFAASLPYLYGVMQLGMYAEILEQDHTNGKNQLNIVLVNTTFPEEESLGSSDPKKMMAYVLEEWRQILKGVKKQHGKPIDLMLFPECIVPYGTYTCVFPLETVRAVFHEILGPQSLHALPVPAPPYARQINTPQGDVFLVNNAFWAQGLANYFQSGVLIGLEDAEDKSAGHREFYSGALYFSPFSAQLSSLKPAERYEKRILVPLGEYIPFDFCRALAASYGVHGSFTHGREAKVFMAGKVPFGISICYEETFGHMMRENKQLGASVLVNLTSDVWYPFSRLPQQHFDHARLRTVENGIALVRSCNMGLTAAVDSLGRMIAVMGKPEEQMGSTAESILLSVPTYSYQTLYSCFGDSLIIGFSVMILLLGLIMTNQNNQEKP